MKRFLLAVLALFVLGAAAFGFLTWQALQGLDPAVLEAEYMTPADRFVEVKGLRVRVREDGPPAAPPIILLHGFTFSLESFDGWAAALSSDYRVIRFDLAGHGLTGPDPQKRYAPGERADFVGDVMDALGIERAAVGGNSLGGLAAWRFASAHPDRVDALVLVSPGAFSANGVSDAPIEAPKAMEVYLRTAPEAGIRAGIARIFSDPSRVSDTRIRTIQDMMRRRGNGQAFVDSINEFTLPDPVADLRRQRMHLVAEDRVRVGRNRECVSGCLGCEFGLQRREELAAVDLERVLPGPQPLDDLQRRIMAIRLDREQPPFRPETAHQGRQHFLGLESGGHAGTPGLRRDDEIVGSCHLVVSLGSVMPLSVHPGRSGSRTE